MIDLAVVAKAVVDSGNWLCTGEGNGQAGEKAGHDGRFGTASHVWQIQRILLDSAEPSARGDIVWLPPERPV